MKLSIIVPVYNVEKYVKECVGTLLKQTIDNFEIIIVDDGSTDNSIDIIKDFNDDRITIISQKNSGLSAARNSGLKRAKGEFVAFVDSDDFIGINEAYEEMYNLAIKEGSEIVAGNAIWYYSEYNYSTMPRSAELFLTSPMSNEEFFINCLKSYRIYAPVWLNIYKRELLEVNKLLFKEGIYHEDEEFTPRVLLKARNISIYNKDFYIYRQREGSIMNLKNNIKRGIDLLNTCVELDSLISSIQNEELKYLFKRYLVDKSIEQIEDYKLTKLSFNMKKSIFRNSVSKGQKIRGLLIIINVHVYFLINKIYKIIIREERE